MGLFYSPSVNGFFNDALHSAIPSDAVEITPAQHELLLQGQAQGRKITFDSARGRPVALAPPEPLIAERRATALAQTRAEAGERIAAIVPLWRQSNDNALIAELAWRDPADLSADQAVQLTQARDRRAQIDAVRDASDAIEAAIATMTVAQLKTLDVAEPAHWPAAPAEV